MQAHLLRKKKGYMLHTIPNDEAKMSNAVVDYDL